MYCKGHELDAFTLYMRCPPPLQNVSINAIAESQRSFVPTRSISDHYVTVVQERRRRHTHDGTPLTINSRRVCALAFSSFP